ncbi:MAG: helix-turn-helix domain-containing protein [Acutalibacteraceae bacterium]
MLNSYPDILTPKDLMSILHLGRNSVYELLHNGVIKARKVGKKYLIPKVCVIDYINSTRYTGI